MKGKIINDPIYGFVRIWNQVEQNILDHAWVQRLGRIKQMGFAQLVYPGAVHTRLHHSLGAMHLMGIALQNLQLKGIDISPEELFGARMAILLHDIGHGPFSHALEHTLIPGVAHEEISLAFMRAINEEQNGKLDLAIQIFTNNYSKEFLHQLVSSQLDMDRLDYLTRDSFYSGVAEGVVGYDRILQMLMVKNNQLLVEEKGVYSVEKFIIARRLMYWQVYLHKTVLSAEHLIINILKRAKYLAQAGKTVFAPPTFQPFLYEKINAHELLNDKQLLAKFALIDDSDIISSLKVWTQHEDYILARLCKMMINRNLYKVQFSNNHLDEEYAQLVQQVQSKHHFSDEILSYFVLKGKASNKTYDSQDDKINILQKNGTIINLSQIENALIHPELTLPTSKYFIAYDRDLLS